VDWQPRPQTAVAGTAEEGVEKRLLALQGDESFHRWQIANLKTRTCGGSSSNTPGLRSRLSRSRDAIAHGAIDRIEKGTDQQTSGRQSHARNTLRRVRRSERWDEQLASSAFTRGSNASRSDVFLNRQDRAKPDHGQRGVLGHRPLAAARGGRC